MQQDTKNEWVRPPIPLAFQLLWYKYSRVVNENVVVVMPVAGEQM
jgi:hypothetical protein